MLFATFLGKNQLHSYYSREVSLPLADSDEFLANITPFARAYLDKGSYILSEESIIIINNEAELSFIGLFEHRLDGEVPTREDLNEPVPPPLPNETSSFPDTSFNNLNVEIQFLCFTSSIGEYSNPDFGDILVNAQNNIEVSDTNFHVVTTGGYNFEEIVTADDRVLQDDNNILVTNNTRFSQNYWNQILFIDNEEATMKGEVLTMIEV